jgi:hypothetical protein
MTMIMKYALCAVAITALVTPAFAANQFFVVQDTATLKCSVVEQKPTIASMKLVGTTVYKTQSEAEIGLKADKACAPKYEPMIRFFMEPRWKSPGLFLVIGQVSATSHTGKRSYYLRDDLAGSV